LSLDNESVVTGSEDNVGHVWDISTSAVRRKLEQAVFGLNRAGDSRIGGVLIQPVGWAEASRNAEAVFAGFA
jgi:WD40 repeat protein